ncbi:MAG: hypothetical protein AAF567_14330 [Actinomycetota bacterium]
MSIDVRCPSCGEADELRGEPRIEDDGRRVIALVCEVCDAEWIRDPAARPRCERCGGDDMREAVQAVVEKSRGTQLSIQSFRQTWLCPTCDAEVYDKYKISNRPLPPDELPTEPEP